MKPPLSHNILLVVITALLTALGSWRIAENSMFKQQQIWLDQQRVLNNDKRYDSQVMYFERTQKYLDEYRNASYLWFFAFLSSAEGNEENGYDGKHLAFHSHESELRGTLGILKYFFTDSSVEKAAAELDAYIASVSWETRIQNKEFIASVTESERKNRRGESTTQLVSKAIDIDTYFALSSNLLDAMANELTSERKAIK